MKAILAAIAVLAASGAASASPVYAVVTFSKGAHAARVIVTYDRLEDYPDCVDMAADQQDRQIGHVICTPVTGEAEAFVLGAEPCDCILDQDD